MTSAIVGQESGPALPKRNCREFELHEDDRVEIEYGQDQIVIRRAEPRYTLQDMFADESPEEWRVLYADSYDWGPDLGQAIVDE